MATSETTPESVASEMVVRRPARPLRRFVRDYRGYRISGLPKGVHAGLPSRTLTLIVPFDHPLELSWDGARGRNSAQLPSMIAGLHDSPVTVHHDGHQHGIQVGITPLGCQALLGCPAGALAGEAIELNGVIGATGNALVDRLSDSASWGQRFAVLDEVFERLITERSMRAELTQAWQVMASTNGAVTIGELAGDLGWSRRHFANQFRAEFGISPKVMAQVMRFERANRRLITAPHREALAQIAIECGYADQAHLNRDFIRFAGAAPTVWLSDPMVFPSVQDGAARDRGPNRTSIDARARYRGRTALS